MGIMKKAFSILLIVLGIASYVGSKYIANQVASGQMKLEKAQKSLKQTDDLLSMSPYTEPLGQGLKQASKGKIQEGQNQIAYYTEMAKNLEIAGYVLIGLGALSLPFTFRKKKK